MLSPDLVQLRDYVRRIALEKVAPRADEIDKTGEYPQVRLDDPRGDGCWRFG